MIRIYYLGPVVKPRDDKKVGAGLRRDDGAGWAVD